jgi:hypothetical protein
LQRTPSGEGEERISDRAVREQRLAAGRPSPEEARGSRTCDGSQQQIVYAVRIALTVAMALLVVVAAMTTN